MTDEVTIYAIDPRSNSNKYGQGRFTKFSKNYDIIESGIITNKQDLIYLASLLMRMDAANRGTEALCFEPRHAIRFNGHWALICFECMHYYSSEGKGHITDFKLRELNHLFEHYGVSPLRSKKGKQCPEFIETDNFSAPIMRDFLFWFGFDLQSTSQDGEGDIKEYWVSPDSTINIRYNALAEERLQTDD